MSRIEKLILRFLLSPKDFSFTELKVLLKYFGYEEVQGAGSRVCFQSENHKIKLHKPHPGNILKQYQISLITEELKKRNML